MDPERHSPLNGGGSTLPETVRVSAVVPTLNEAGVLPQLIAELRELGPDVEIVVSDGGSTDRTVQLARSLADQVVQGPAGRGGQLNRGAAVASASVFLFVHADSRFAPNTRTALLHWLEDERSKDEVAVFRFALDAEGIGWRLLEWGQAWRQRLTGIAFGDQGLVIPRRIFESVGGYPDIPVMEDARLMKVLRATSSIRTLPAALITSARRYRRRGRVWSVISNQALLGLHFLGIKPGRLARSYRPESHSIVPAEPTLLVFAKAPEPGKVKTRLAKDVGDEAAARFYRVLGSRVVDQVKDRSHRTVVCFDPPDAEEIMRGWLGEDLEYRPQIQGDLGARMEAAVRSSVADGGPVVVVGTDAPDVDARTVRSAFAALVDHDLVLGPAEDGGYYLIGLVRPEPLLFQGIPWSTSGVYAATLRAAEAAGLRVHELPVLKDIDRLEDVPPGLEYALQP